MSGFYSQELIDQIRDANDIVDLITEYVPLKKRGKNYVGLCPFHAEKAPSFNVSPDKQMFYCFGCGEGGNVISFLMKHEKFGFSDAIRHLAKRANISLPKRSFDKQKTQQFEKLYYANQVANEYFRKNFYREAPGKKARQYLNRRGFDPEIIKQFSLGYAPDDWEGLIKFAKNKDIEMEILNQAGLVVPRAESSGSTTLTTRGYYDRFRNRIIFPIFNLSGKVVGFGGRVLNEKDEPKYLNSPETPIYQKGKILYGLNFSKDEIRKKGSAVLVEGYVDLLSLYQAGITNVVASSGTAFTANQARLLSRYAEGVYLLFDADTAGQSATFRSVDLLFSEGVEVFVVSLPRGEDPDSFVKKFGVEEVAKRIEHAQTFIDFKRESLPKDFEELSLKEQEKVILDLVETARKITNDLRRNLFVKKVAQAFKIDETSIFKMVAKRTTKGTYAPKKEASISAVTGQEKIEMGILRILMEDEKLMKLTEGKLELDDFSTPEHKEIFQLLRPDPGRTRTYAQAPRTSPSALLDKTENEKTKQILSRIAALDLGTAELSIQLTDHLKALHNLKKDRKIKTLKESIKKALENGETEKANLLTKEFERLKRV